MSKKRAETHSYDFDMEIFTVTALWIRSLKWGVVHSCRSTGCKNIKGQSWRWIKNLLVQPAPRASGSRLAELAIFFATSNFDLKYFCNLLTNKNVQYLNWKIWFIAVWNLKPKAVVWLLTGFMLGQSTLISYHTEANGCIFFAAGVDGCLLSSHLVLHIKLKSAL